MQQTTFETSTRWFVLENHATVWLMGWEIATRYGYTRNNNGERNHGR